MRKIVIITLFGVLFSVNVFALTLTKESFFVSQSGTNQVKEYTQKGVLAQSIDVPYPGGVRTTSEQIRDIAVYDGKIFVVNGTFAPYLSMYDLKTKIWKHFSNANWKIYNNGTYGGVAVFGKFVFVTSSISGVIRFNTGNGVSEVFASPNSIDLNIGLDGLLYVLSPSGSPGGRTIDVYEPLSMSLIRSIDLTTIFGWNEHRAVAGAENSDIYVVNWDGDIRHLNYLGELIQTINIRTLIGCGSCGAFYDIDISKEGLILASDWSGNVFMFDKNLSFVGSITTELRNGVFIAPINKVSVKLVENDSYISAQENLMIELKISDVNVTETVNMKTWYETPEGYIGSMQNRTIQLSPGVMFIGPILSTPNSGTWKTGKWQFGITLIRSIDGKVLAESVIPIIVE